VGLVGVQSLTAIMRRVSEFSFAEDRPAVATGLSVPLLVLLK
jgi:hypothetical protein